MDKTLYTELEKSGDAGKRLIKHLSKVGIKDWENITPSRLFDFKMECKKKLSPNTQKLYFSQLCTFLDRYVDEYGFCKDYRNELRTRGVAVVKVALTPGELHRLERVVVQSEIEETVLHQFLIGAYTGMRRSDAENVTAANVKDGVLTYVSKKTGVEASIPVSDRIMEYIDATRGRHIVTTTALQAIRRLCRRAGINEEVKVYHAGHEQTGPKWLFVSTHTARVSFCTNLNAMGVGLVDISRLAGHTNTVMTERYIARQSVNLPSKAMKYLTQE